MDSKIINIVNNFLPIFGLYLKIIKKSVNICIDPIFEPDIHLIELK